MAAPTTPQFKSPRLKDDPTSEKLYAHLSATSRRALTVDQIRLMHRMFSRADENSNGALEHNELEKFLLTMGTELTHRVMRVIVADAHERHIDLSARGLTFIEFVAILEDKLSHDETLRLMTMEEEYLRSMGIDDEQREEILEFRKHKPERKASVDGMHAHLAAGTELHKSDRQERRASTVPNDEEEYRRSFGLEEKV